MYLSGGGRQLRSVAEQLCTQVIADVASGFLTIAAQVETLMTLA